MITELRRISHVFKVQSYVVADNIIPCGPFPIDDQIVFNNAYFPQFLFHMSLSMDSSIILGNQIIASDVADYGNTFSANVGRKHPMDFAVKIPGTKYLLTEKLQDRSKYFWVRPEDAKPGMPSTVHQNQGTNSDFSSSYRRVSA